MHLKYLSNQFVYYSRLGKGHAKRMILKFLLAKTPFLRFVNKWLYNIIYNSLIKDRQNIVRPRTLQIETTNFCNARCIMCPHGHMKRKQKNMNLENFIRICKNIFPYEKINLIVLSGFGEPFMDKGLIEKIKWINKNYPKLQIDLYTNASLLKPEITDEFLKLKIHKINFSINGSQKTYPNIMGLDYEKTKSNILYFLEKRKELKLRYPLTNMSIMSIEENKEDIGKIVNFWIDKTDSVMAYLPSDWAGKLKSISGLNQTPFKKKRWPCFALFSGITVDVEGNVIMCCRDYESKVKFGNLLKENIKKIRNSKLFQSLLRKQLAFDFKTPICDKCDNSFDSSLNWW